MKICENCKLKAMHVLGIGFVVGYILCELIQEYKMIEYEMIAYPIAGLFTFCMVTFFWCLSRLGGDR